VLARRALVGASVSGTSAARSEGKRFEYRRREPQASVLHKLVRENIEPFLQYTREHYRKPLPKYVEHELRRLLRCGDPWQGFTRVRCRKCRHEFFVAFSCGARTICCSCAGRRMAAASIHLTDRVLPDVPVRQFVLSVPYELRMLLASKSEVLSAVIRIVMRVVLGFYRKRGRELRLGRAEAGALSFVQRSGGSLNANCHLHSIAIDGIYTRDEHTGAPRFHFVEPPSAAELAQMVSTICERVCKMLRRRGLVGEVNHGSNEAEQVLEALQACRKVALSRGRFERLDEHGRAQQRLFPDDELPIARKKAGRWTADVSGFSLNAGVSFGALDRKGRERLVRYCTRPPLAMDRLSVLRDGSVAYRTKWRSTGGTTHRVMAPREFMARLASIVAPPRRPLTRYHGVLAPNSSWRRQIVQASRASSEPCVDACCAQSPAKSASNAPAAASPADSTSQVAQPSMPAALPREVPSAESQKPEPPKRSRTSTSYVPWAQLMQRTLGINPLNCPVCKATMTLLAVITKQDVILKILSHLNVPRYALMADEPSVAYYDMTDEPVPSWVLGLDPDPEADARAPPASYEGIDPPSPDE
jgi:hypothetical protein